MQTTDIQLFLNTQIAPSTPSMAEKARELERPWSVLRLDVRKAPGKADRRVWLHPPRIGMADSTTAMRMRKRRSLCWLSTLYCRDIIIFWICLAKLTIIIQLAVSVAINCAKFLSANVVFRMRRSKEADDTAGMPLPSFFLTG